MGGGELSGVQGHLRAVGAARRRTHTQQNPMRAVHPQTCTRDTGLLISSTHTHTNTHTHSRKMYTLSRNPLELYTPNTELNIDTLTHTHTISISVQG